MDNNQQPRSVDEIAKDIREQMAVNNYIDDLWFTARANRIRRQRYVLMLLICIALGGLILIKFLGY